MTEPMVSRPAALPRLLRRFFLQRPLVGMALLVLVIVALLAILAPILPLRPPDAIDTLRRLAPPSYLHPFGTDNFGRDLFSRVIYSGQISLPIGFFVMLISAGAGVVIGLASGYYPRVDAILMRAWTA